jgi:hypothetical protein
MKDDYFEIVRALKTWLLEKLENYEYNKQDIRNKIDDPNYQLTSSPSNVKKNIGKYSGRLKINYFSILVLLTKIIPR